MRRRLPRPRPRRARRSCAATSGPSTTARALSPRPRSLARVHACLPSWGLGPEGLLRWPRPVLSRLPCPADIYDKVSGDMQKKGYSCECLGGGRISHQSQDKKIHVYGYSMGYGRAQHSISTEKIKAMYPDYEVTWADDGY
ncbi:14 kDa phosphohistidine phosphatase isoform X1 [Canis lupus baileyi]|uniref:14 kDa phosphohistidine phosphatase isoform X1 n=1 Tax=Canis lupus familiaris TaxID=9615 RepID=UPI000BAA11B2|nr:14 kDa phosphohistidine phosphatase isoform X1 [Canis lupus familiaris]XP_025331658.1 14 kDa phosphohistidine phosphatase isoform X1 [Canis lupus dingo]XP_038404644.1 14 kDa phosphohistidine phosphatase isoform X1 [Canis lupus familiaris]XP_038533866.1 14 kDa phosphohistidine phosphatase isoform X1 [Canis lupus familiaris]|eukprot:XP_022279259.1 14 kDa phosphohistidine phosphatase isoform X1 [Canis lupus familiaris]